MASKTRNSGRAAAAALLMLSACGGGSGTQSGRGESGSAEGVYAGRAAGRVTDGFELLVRGDGSLWALYGDFTNDQFYPRGFLEGSSMSSNGLLSSNDARDFSFVPAISAELTGTYTPESISGTFTEVSGTTDFGGTLEATAPYVYDTPARIADVAGSWTLALMNAETASLVVLGTGGLSGVSSLGCQFSGQATPDSGGKNVFSIGLSFGGPPCAVPNQSANGVALYSPLSNGGHELIVLAVDSSRSYGFGGFGNR